MTLMCYVGATARALDPPKPSKGPSRTNILCLEVVSWSDSGLALTWAMIFDDFDGRGQFLAAAAGFARFRPLGAVIGQNGRAEELWAGVWGPNAPRRVSRGSPRPQTGRCRIDHDFTLRASS